MDSNNKMNFMNNEEKEKLEFVERFRDVEKFRDGVKSIYNTINEELSCNWKSYDITVDDKVYHLHPASTPEEELQQERDRLEIIKFLLHDAINIMLENTINNNDESEFLTPDPFSLIYKLMFPVTKQEDHQYEVYKEEIVSNLDENGVPITAKKLNMDSVHVKWQNRNEFNDDYFGPDNVVNVVFKEVEAKNESI